MSGDRRLAAIAEALERVGISFLVMGGHAVRYYGVERNTIDYDFHISFPEGVELRERLLQCRLPSQADLLEGPTWRRRDFRRFQIGRLPDGREEWLEFWIHNHLLPPFPELHARRENGVYGGRALPFLSLSDLIRSKETERESDWQDIALLEEILDARNLAHATEPEAAGTSLSQLRSRHGFERAVKLGLMAEERRVGDAVARARHPVSRAYLLPFCKGCVSAEAIVSPPGVIREVLAGPLRTVTPNSARHLALVEAVRRFYKQAAMAADRADKAAAANT